MEDNVRPFIGPRPFTREEQDRFFGRTREIASLASLVIAHPIVFLYGQSGTGKTSLINAGLIQRLKSREEFDIFPVVRPGGRADRTGAESSTASPFVYATLLRWSEEFDTPALSTDANLASYLANLTPPRDEDGEPRPRLLVFDQLEELFRDQIDASREQHDFFEQIGELLYASRARVTFGGVSSEQEAVPTRVLLSMREEYIAELDNFADLLPEKLRIRFRLERLRQPAALEAVTGPLGLTSLAFAPGVAEQLVDELLEVRIEAGVGEERKAIDVRGEFVEPVQLQVVCERLVRDLPPGASEITFEHLSRFGSVDATLSDFYKDAAAFAAASSGVPQTDLERWCETNLITDTGTRSVVHRGPTQSDGMVNAAPDALVDRLLLRKEPRAGAEWYELTHDRFIAPIQAARVDRERREAEQRGIQRARQLLRMAGSLAAAAVLIVALVLVWAAIYFGNQKPVCASEGLTCAWVFSTERFIFGRPAISGSMAYVPSLDGSVYAVDTSKPKEMTLFGVNLPFVRYAPGRQTNWTFSGVGPVWSSPALRDGFVYFGSEDKAFVAVDAATGEMKWRQLTEGAIVDSPAVDDGVVYFGSFDQNLYAVASENGAQLWRVETGGALASSPVVVNGTVYVGSNDFSLYAIDARSGTVEWTFPTRHEVRSTPAVVDGVIYVGSFDQNLYAIDEMTHQPRWVFPTGGKIRSSPSVVDGIVFFGSYDKNVYAVDAGTGREIWRFPTGEWVVASPLVHEGVVYIGSDDGNFYALDAATGAELGRLTTNSLVESFPAVVGDLIVFGAGNGKVYAIEQVQPSGARWPLLGLPATPIATPLSATPASATPVASADGGTTPTAS